ncbi:MAG: hypothetical protein Tsb009_27230 [Planctomycetaceae bacterium]
MSSQSHRATLLVPVAALLVGLLGFLFWRTQNPSETETNPNIHIPDKSFDNPNSASKNETQQNNTAESKNKQRKEFQQVLNAMTTGSREQQLQHRQKAFVKAQKSKEWREFLKDVAEGKIKGTTREQQFHAATIVAGFGHPSRLGPNSLEGMPLADYLAMQKSLRPHYNPEERHLDWDPKLKELRVTVTPNKSDDLTIQEILWSVINKYKLKFELRDGKTFYVSSQNNS